MLRDLNARRGRDDIAAATPDPIKQRAPRLPAIIAASIALTSAVSAESLAQPTDPALERAAAAYIIFRSDVEVVEATPFTSAETTREAHRRLAAHDSKALSGGWVAYAALVAAGTPSFRKSIEEQISSNKKVKGLRGRDAFLARLAEEPGFARSLKGANDAIDAVRQMTAGDAGRFAALGEAFKTQAYALQKTAWGKAKMPAPSARLQEADAYKSKRPEPEPVALPVETAKGVTQPLLASAPEPWTADWGAKSGTEARPEPNAEFVMERVLNLAARYAAGAAGAKLVETYARNDRAEQCLSMATLTLRQCIAATRAPYEEAFCLGEHALNDVSRCVGWVAGAGPAAD